MAEDMLRTYRWTRTIPQPKTAPRYRPGDERIDEDEDLPDPSFTGVTTVLTNLLKPQPKSTKYLTLSCFRRTSAESDLAQRVARCPPLQPLLHAADRCTR